MHPSKGKIDYRLYFFRLTRIYDCTSWVTSGMLTLTHFN